MSRWARDRSGHGVGPTRKPGLHRAFTNARFKALGLLSMEKLAAAYSNPPNRRGTDPYARWCGRGGIARCPPIPIDGSEHGAKLDHVGTAAVMPHRDRYIGKGAISPPIAHRKAAISRAIAATTTGNFLPAALRRR